MEGEGTTETRRSRLAAVGALALALAFGGGCGGDDDAPIEPIGDGTTASEPENLGAEQFIDQADVRCAEANIALASIADNGAESLGVGASQSQAITEGLIEDLQALGTPEDPDGSLEQFLDALEEQARIFGRQADAATAGETETYNALDGELAQAEADARIAAEDYGFSDCGQEGTAVTAEDPETATEPDAGGTAPAPAPTTTTPAPAPAPAPEAPPPSGGTGADGSGSGGSGGGGSDGSGGSGGISPG